MRNFSGLGVALVTPFDKNFAVDFNALEKILHHLYKSKALDYLVVLGSTGEAATLSKSEKQAILSFVNSFNQHQLPLVFGHSSNNTSELVHELEDIDFSGYDAILSASPAYVKPTQKGIIKHYTHLADNSPLPIILYNVPSRTSSNMSATTSALLSTHENIIGVKEASGDLVQAMEIEKNTDNEFMLISGDDMLTVPLLSVGAIGLISVLGNAYPEIFKEIIDYAIAGNYPGATKTAQKMLKINDLMYEEGNPAGVKQVLAHLDLCEPIVRLPLMPATDGLSQKIKQALL